MQQRRVERYNQPLSILFENGNYIELSAGESRSKISGVDLASGQASGQLGSTHTGLVMGIKYDFNERLSGVLLADQPYGAGLTYPSGGGLLSGTSVSIDSVGTSGILRYRLDENYSIHGGFRALRGKADVSLAGPLYGPISGYTLKMEERWESGYLIGAAYERREMGLRIAATYFSEVNFDFKMKEGVGGMPLSSAVSRVTMPKAINLQAQTGITQNFLVFGSVRWVDWSSFIISPPWLQANAGVTSLASLPDTTSYVLGGAYRFNPTWSGSLFATYERSRNKLVSPLVPVSGYRGLGAAVVYTGDKVKVTAGVTRLKLGDANPSVGEPRKAVSQMSGNSALAVALKIGVPF